MDVKPNERCGKKPTAAEYVSLQAGPLCEEAEIWIGHDETGHYRYGFLIKATPTELAVIRELMQKINDENVQNRMLPDSMNNAAADENGNLVRVRR